VAHAGAHRELRVDADLQGVGQRLLDLVAQPGAGGLGDVDAQERVAEFRGAGGKRGDRAADRPQPTTGHQRHVDGGGRGIRCRDPMLPGETDDLGQDGFLLAESAVAFQGLTDVPVGRVQELHGDPSRSC
jgi:hypothetical protein